MKIRDSGMPDEELVAREAVGKHDQGRDANEGRIHC